MISGESNLIEIEHFTTPQHPVALQIIVLTPAAQKVDVLWVIAIGGRHMLTVHEIRHPFLTLNVVQENLIAELDASRRLINDQKFYD